MPEVNNSRPRSVVFPIILIAVGVLFLYSSWQPAFNPWHIMITYWPLLLIFAGLAKLWDSSRQSPNAPRRGSFGSLVAILAVVFILFALSWHGRTFSRNRGFSSAMKHEIHTLDLQGAHSVNASVEMSSGELNIGGGTSRLLDASFNFRDGGGQPAVDYHVSGTIGDLRISESGSSTHFVGSNHADWNLHFGSTAPLALTVELGAGEGKLNLRDLPVTKLDLHMGAGRVDLDLTGERKQDLVAEIQGGVGEAIIRLPKNVGVIANASGGIGSIDAHGLKESGGEYTNELYGKTPSTIHLTVQGGIGHISLIQEP